MAQPHPSLQPPEDSGPVALEYEVPEPPGRWLMDEDEVPERPLHDQIIDLLKLLLLAFVKRENRSALVARNLGCRWDPSDARVGIDPDVVLVEPAPPEGEQLTTLRIWEPGHAPPRVVVEVVSEHTADKDYLDAPARRARLGAEELWVFDPLLLGPSTTGGPFVLQVWKRKGRRMVRQHAGPGPAWSEELSAWLVVTEGGRRLRLAEDRAGTRLWPTEAEEQARLAEQARSDQRKAEADLTKAEAAQQQAEAQKLELARQTVHDICELLGVELISERRAHIDALDLDGLEALRQGLKTRRAWPA